MYLTTRFSPSFHKRVRSRGQAYFADRSVEIIEGSKDIIRAVVSGTYEYEVTLKIDVRDLLVGCTCPYSDNDYCKHLWATMLAAELKGYLMGTSGLPTRLVLSDPFDLEEGDEGYDDDEVYEYKRSPWAPRLKAAPSAKPLQQRSSSSASKPPAWHQWLESVNRSMNSLTEEQTRPWPAVEAQAIDRAHRIGQARQVFAYRLIARDTVEEKVLELQQTKRELADAIINADNSLIRSLGREDLELLLS